MEQREERLLVALAQKYAPSILSTLDRSGDPQARLGRLARRLADFNLLILEAEQPYSLQLIQRDVNSLIEEWLNGYIQFYLRICRDLFPSYARWNFQYIDNQWPILLYMAGEATPVIQRMAGYIVPYVTLRQFDNRVLDAELIGLIDLVLHELEAGSLSRNAFKQLRDDCAAILKQMQLTLTPFDREIFTESQRIIPIRSDPPPVPPPAPPATLPEPISPRHDDTQQVQTTGIIPAVTQPPENGTKSPSPRAPRRETWERRPPVPPLPRSKTDE
jgi:hypothetical protein